MKLPILESLKTQNLEKNISIFIFGHRPNINIFKNIFVKWDLTGVSFDSQKMVAFTGVNSQQTQQSGRITLHFSLCLLLYKFNDTTLRYVSLAYRKFLDKQWQFKIM